MKRKLEQSIIMGGLGSGVGAILPDVIAAYYPGTQGDGTIIPAPWNQNQIIIPLVSGAAVTIIGLLLKSKQKLIKYALVTFGMATLFRSIYMGLNTTTAARAQAAFSPRLSPARMNLNRRRQPIPSRAMQTPNAGRVIRGRLAANGSSIRPSKFQSTATGLSSDTIVA